MIVRSATSPSVSCSLAARAQERLAVLELIRLFFCEHVATLPEAASIVFAGRFSRSAQPALRQAAQRAIYHVQRELESVADADDSALVICDQGTVDCAAYWTGDGDLFSSVGSTREIELAHYDTVIHLRTPTLSTAYNRRNPFRIESLEAAAIDEQIAAAWSDHPHRFVIDSTEDFLHKAARALSVLRDQVPECCSRPTATEPRGTAMSFYEKGPVRIHFEEFGKGVPLLLIAGGGLNSTIAALTGSGSPFNPIEEFKADYRCIASDLRNANGGESSGPLEATGRGTRTRTTTSV